MKLLYDCPMYNLKAGDEIEVKYEPTSEDLLRYGEFLTADDLLVQTGNTDDGYEWIRIRIIAYNNHIYYHKMVDGETNKVEQLD